MNVEFSGVERRLEKLKSCLSNLEVLREKTKEELMGNANLRAIAERNLELACQCCIDIANRIISLEDIEKPIDYTMAIIRLGEAAVLPLDFAKKFSSIAGLRNILIHEYLDINWNRVYERLQNLEEFYQFMEAIKKWLAKQE